MKSLIPGQVRFTQPNLDHVINTVRNDVHTTAVAQLLSDSMARKLSEGGVPTAAILEGHIDHRNLENPDRRVSRMRRRDEVKFGSPALGVPLCDAQGAMFLMAEKLGVPLSDISSQPVDPKRVLYWMWKNLENAELSNASIGESKVRLQTANDRTSFSLVAGVKEPSAKGPDLATNLGISKFDGYTARMKAMGISIDVCETWNGAARKGYTLLKKIFPEEVMAPISDFKYAMSMNLARRVAFLNRDKAPNNPDLELPGYKMVVAKDAGGTPLAVATGSTLPTGVLIVGYTAVDSEKKNYQRLVGGAEEGFKKSVNLGVFAAKSLIRWGKQDFELSTGTPLKIVACEAANLSHLLWGKFFKEGGRVIIEDPNGHLKPFGYMQPPFTWDKNGNPVLDGDPSQASLVSKRDVMVQGKRETMIGVDEVFCVLTLTSPKDNPDVSAIVEAAGGFTSAYYVRPVEYFAELQLAESHPNLTKRQLNKMLQDPKVLEAATPAYERHVAYLQGLTEAYAAELTGAAKVHIMSEQEYRREAKRRGQELPSLNSKGEGERLRKFGK